MTTTNTGSPTGAAVVGTGFCLFGHVRALRDAGFEVLAIVGRDLEKTRARGAPLDVPTVSNNLEQLLADDPAIRLVTVATPPEAQYTGYAGTGRRLPGNDLSRLLHDPVRNAVRLHGADRSGAVLPGGRSSYRPRWPEPRGWRGSSRARCSAIPNRSGSRMQPARGRLECRPNWSTPRLNRSPSANW